MWRNIRRLPKLDPANARLTRRNAEAYRAQLRSLDSRTPRSLSRYPRAAGAGQPAREPFPIWPGITAADGGLLWPSMRSQVTPKRMARLIALRLHASA